LGGITARGIIVRPGFEMEPEEQNYVKLYKAGVFLSQKESEQVVLDKQRSKELLNDLARHFDAELTPTLKQIQTKIAREDSPFVGAFVPAYLRNKEQNWDIRSIDDLCCFRVNHAPPGASQTTESDWKQWLQAQGMYNIKPFPQRQSYRFVGEGGQKKLRPALESFTGKPITLQRGAGGKLTLTILPPTTRD
jgi:hypothetical protein